MAGAGISQAIGGGLGTASTAIQTFGLDKAAKAEEEAAQALALLIREQTLVDTERERRQNRKQMAQHRGHIARSGISLEGSQLDLLLDNARELELNAIYIERFGKAAASQENARARSIGTAATYGRAAGIIESFKSGGQAAAGAYAASSGYNNSSPSAVGNTDTLYRPDFSSGFGNLGPGGR